MRVKKANWRLMGIVLSFAFLIGLCGRAAQAVETETETASVTERAALTTGQQNIVKRAYQMTNVRWRPLKNVIGWRGKLTYQAGKTYTGVPYGQPVDAAYVPWDASLLEFVNAVNQSGSKMYTSYSSFTARAPYYSLDCSGFVSYAWDVPSRTPSSSLYKWATVIENATYQDLQVGDALCNPGVHASLVTDVVYDSTGAVISVEISEATTGTSTNACCHSIRYGKGGVNTIDRITTRFFNDGYKLMRCNTRDSATYTHSCASPLPGDNCSICGAGQFTETPVSLTVTYPYDITLYVLPNKSTVQIGTIAANTKIRVTASCIGTDGDLWYKTANEEWLLQNPDCAHRYTLNVTQAATCTQAGSGLYACDYCDELYTATIPATGHDYRTTVVLPDCVEEGYTQYTCANCGDEYLQDVTPPTGHSYENGVCTGCGDYRVNISLGDLDRDGTLDDKDVEYLLWHTLFEESYPLNQPADFDGSGTVDNKDVEYLLWHTLYPEEYPL